MISFFSKVVVEDDPNSANVMRFYPQVTDKSGLFLTKTFMTKVSSGKPAAAYHRKFKVVLYRVIHSHQNSNTQ